MRKKTTLSKKIMISNSGSKIHTLMKRLTTIKEELATSYKNMKLKKEKEPLGKKRKKKTGLKLSFVI